MSSFQKFKTLKTQKNIYLNKKLHFFINREKNYFFQLKINNLKLFLKKFIIYIFFF